VEHTVQDLELGDRAAAMFDEPGMQPLEVLGDSRRHPAVAPGQQADEVWPAALDLLEAVGKQLAFGLLLGGDAPAQIDLGPRDAARLAALAQLGEDPLDQDFVIVLHVAKRRRDEDADVPRHQPTSTPGLRMPCGSSARLTAASASPNSGGRSRSYHGRWIRPTAWWCVMVPPAAARASEAADLIARHCASSPPGRSAPTKV